MDAATLRALVAPRTLLLHLIGAVAVTAAVLLGLWQLDAWQAGRAAEARDLAAEPPRALSQVLSPDQPFPADHVGRPVTLTGTWLPDSDLVVTDRRLAGRRGVWAVTPVAVCAGPDRCTPGEDPAMLVVRGWAPTAAAVPPAPSGQVRLTGRLQPGEGSGLPDPDPTDAVLPELRIASAIQHVDQDLYGGYVVAERPFGAGLEPVTPESLPEPSSFTSLQNLLYAVQWWLFGVFALFLWQRWVRDEVERGRGAARSDRSDDGGAGPEDYASTTSRTAEIASSP